jgi:O-acetyl-ADP-ribose deacetylase (regulator of RNase III)
MLSFHQGRLTIEIADGDIAAQDVDAVVNAANDHFWMGAGVAGAIKSRGGASIEAEAMALGPIDPGGSVITGGGSLRARFVIHAAVMGQDLQTSGPLIYRATRSALALAEERELTSIAFPAFGTGVGGFPLRDCAEIMLEVVRSHQPAHLRLIRFVLFGHSAYRTFAEAASAMFGSPLDGPPDCPLSS